MPDTLGLDSRKAPPT